MSGGRRASAMRLFDAHCHLQDPRVSAVAPQLIIAALDSGVRSFAVNGTHEKDWHLVKQMAEQQPSVIPCFGLHPWWVAERSPSWMASLRGFFASTPSAAVGEIGLDKGSHGKNINFMEQVDVFRQQLELAKDLGRPVSIHCVEAFGDLLKIMQSIGPFPAGVILHSYIGTAEMVPEFARLGSYFSFSGHLMPMNLEKAKKILKAVPSDRILLESDAPDALPKLKTNSASVVPGNYSTVQELLKNYGNSTSEISTLPTQDLNHPANIHNMLNYVATLLEMPEEDLAEATYQNAMQLFTYPGSKVGEKSLED